MARTRKRDNKATVAIAGSDASFKKSLYLAQRAVFLQELKRSGKCVVAKIGTDENVSDILTKLLDAKRFARLRHSAVRARRVRVRFRRVLG